MISEEEIDKKIQDELIKVLEKSSKAGMPFLKYSELKAGIAITVKDIGRKKLTEAIGALKNVHIISSYKISNREIYYLREVVSVYNDFLISNKR